MIISISPSNYKDKWVVNIDGEPFQQIHKTIFGRKPIIKGNFTSREQFEEFFSKWEYEHAFQYTLKRFSMKNYASSELKKLLKSRLVSEKNIEKIIHDSIQRGYIDDQNWINSFIRSQMARRNGPKAILYKLMLKGIPKDVAEETVSHMANSESSQTLISEIIKRKYRSLDLKDYKNRNKVIGALVRKGFDFDDILLALNVF